MEKKYAFASLLVLTVLVSTFGFVSASSNAAPGPVRSVPGTIYTFTLSGEGAFFNPNPTFPTLFGLKSGGFYDTYVMTIPKTTHKLEVTIVLEDGFIMGDTIGLYKPLGVLLAGPNLKTVNPATSPTEVIYSAVFTPGTYVFFVGYTAQLNAPPHGYWVYFQATCGDPTTC
ncbi:MAG TPA: hypothetical protein VEG61_06165 [Candidatus Dormibacteraeota bacterium]|nr:hypothetical protein [Candidatus Dormibacteraeota bacterium]